MWEMLNEHLGSVIFLVVALALIAVGMTADARTEAKNARLAASWEIVMDGELDHVVYGGYPELRREGSMSKRDVTYVMKITAFHFSDGRACVANGFLDLHFPKGTRVRVEQNGLGGFRVERA